MTKRYTFDQIVKLNGGNIQDARDIIDLYIYEQKLVRINNDSFDGYLSETLEEKNLILRSKVDRFVEKMDPKTKLISWIVAAVGWILFIITQLTGFNLLEWLKTL